VSGLDKGYSFSSLIKVSGSSKRKGKTEKQQKSMIQHFVTNGTHESIKSKKWKKIACISTDLTKN
jgi:hypothetical protein